MCGLVGMAGDLTFRHRAVMKSLLFFNTLRGKDSTGVSVFDQEARTVETKKSVLPGYEFIQQAGIDSLLSVNKGVWMGHGRAKTVGDVSRINAHPFEVRTERDTISHFGAHNGTLTNKWDIQKLLDGEEFGTDSEALINLIAKYGVKDAIKEVEGAYAVSWWDSKDNSVNFIRNKERPLCYALIEDESVLIWASEAWMINVACLREDVKLKQNKEGNGIIYAMLEDTHYKWLIPSFKNDDKTFSSPRKKGGLLGKPEKKTFSRYGGYYGHNWWDYEDDNNNVVSKTGEEATKETETTKEKGKRSATTVIGFEGEAVDRGYAEELKRAGCDWCGDTITDNAFSWLDEMSLCCQRCLKGEHIFVSVKEGKIMDRVLSLIDGRKNK